MLSPPGPVIALALSTKNGTGRVLEMTADLRNSIAELTKLSKPFV